jgi:hypothetical protein
MKSPQHTASFVGLTYLSISYFLLVFTYICDMDIDNQSTTPRRPRGRPATPPPNGRDLEAEVSGLAKWLEARPAIKPATISKAAGLHRETLGNMLRKYRAPQAGTLDSIYEALKHYEYSPVVNTNKNN